MATLEDRDHPKQAWLVFHEAKHYTNPELKAAPKRRPPILNQIGRYKGSIGSKEGALTYNQKAKTRSADRETAPRAQIL